MVYNDENEWEGIGCPPPLLPFYSRLQFTLNYSPLQQCRT